MSCVYKLHLNAPWRHCLRPNPDTDSKATKTLSIDLITLLFLVQTFATVADCQMRFSCQIWEINPNLMLCRLWLQLSNKFILVSEIVYYINKAYYISLIQELIENSLVSTHELNSTKRQHFSLGEESEFPVYFFGFSDMFFKLESQNNTILILTKV